MESAVLPCPPSVLDLEHTLVCGQAFRWRQQADELWACVLFDAATGQNALLRLRRAGDTVIVDGPERLAREYLRLEVDLAALARQFREADPALGPALENFPGLRVLRQDPVECLFSFLCTSASPLHRIRRCIDGMCRTWGAPFGDGLFGFPPVERLADASEAELKALGLGYRARYIRGAAQRILAQGGPGWLRGLRQRPYAEAKAALMTLPGVGAKIADCVCLFSMDKDGAVPVDTHIRRVAEGRYAPFGAKDEALGDALRARFGPYAGWAQQYLFYQDLFGKGAWDAYAAQWQCPRE